MYFKLWIEIGLARISPTGTVCMLHYEYVAHYLLLKQKQPDAASWLLSLQRNKRWNPWTVNNGFFYNQIYVCCVLFQPQLQPRKQTEPKCASVSLCLNSPFQVL